MKLKYWTSIYFWRAQSIKNILFKVILWWNCFSKPDLLGISVIDSVIGPALSFNHGMKTWPTWAKDHRESEKVWLHLKWMRLLKITNLLSSHKSQSAFIISIFILVLQLSKTFDKTYFEDINLWRNFQWSPTNYEGNIWQRVHITAILFYCSNGIYDRI